MPVLAGPWSISRVGHDSLRFCFLTHHHTAFIMPAQFTVVLAHHCTPQIRQRCGLRVYVPEPKLALLACQGLPPDALADTFTTDPRATPVHVVGWGVLGDTWPYFRPNFVAMQRTAEELGVAGEVVGFCPTGWVYEMRRNAFPVRTRESLSVHLVPYSEHSSYSELREYVKWLKPKQVRRFT